MGWHPGARSSSLPLLRLSPPRTVWSSVPVPQEGRDPQLTPGRELGGGRTGLPGRRCTQQGAVCSCLGSLASFLLSEEQSAEARRAGDAGRSLPLNNWSQSRSRWSPHASCPPWPRTWLLPGPWEGGMGGNGSCFRSENPTWPWESFSVGHPCSALPRALGSGSLLPASFPVSQASSEAGCCFLPESSLSCPVSPKSNESFRSWKSLPLASRSAFSPPTPYSLNRTLCPVLPFYLFLS